MYHKTKFEFRYHMKLDFHRQIHYNAEGKRVVTLEGVDVCMTSWRHIAGVSKLTFHQFKGYAARGERAQPHGNMGIQKTRKHTLQAVATLKCILKKLVDHMPHRTHTLPSREKVVSKVLPATFLWKEILPKVNVANIVFGLKEESASNISKIGKLNFREYCVKKPGDNFARCAVCDRFYA